MTFTKTSFCTEPKAPLCTLLMEQQQSPGVIIIAFFNSGHNWTPGMSFYASAGNIFQPHSSPTFAVYIHKTYLKITQMT